MMETEQLVVLFTLTVLYIFGASFMKITFAVTFWFTSSQ